MESFNSFCICSMFVFVEFGSKLYVPIVEHVAYNYEFVDL